jgi:hypothetical protein
MELKDMTVKVTTEITPELKALLDMASDIKTIAEKLQSIHVTIEQAVTRATV